MFTTKRWCPLKAANIQQLLFKLDTKYYIQVYLVLTEQKDKSIE